MDVTEEKTKYWMHIKKMKERLGEEKIIKGGEQ